MKTETCKFIPLSSLVPANWKNWFYEQISNNAPFSWGDNNRTLVSADRFCVHCQDVFDGMGDDINTKEKSSFIKKIKFLEETYIDLEN